MESEEKSGSNNPFPCPGSPFFPGRDQRHILSLNMLRFGSFLEGGPEECPLLALLHKSAWRCHQCTPCGLPNFRVGQADLSGLWPPQSGQIEAKTAWRGGHTLQTPIFGSLMICYLILKIQICKFNISSSGYLFYVRPRA